MRSLLVLLMLLHAASSSAQMSGAGGAVAVSSVPGNPSQDGTDAAGVQPPAGGVGIRGWLSGIYSRLGNALSVTVSGTPNVAVTSAPAVKSAATTGTIAGCTVGTSSTQCLAANSATTHLQLQNNSTATIACTFSGTAALNSSNSFQLSSGQAANWGVATGWVPTAALSCIASSASSPLYVEYN